METGHQFYLPQLRGETTNFTCTLIYASTQVLRFHLTDGSREMTLQKIIFPKARFAWKLLSSNFPFTSEHAGENLNLIFRAIDEALKNLPTQEAHFKNKKG